MSSASVLAVILAAGKGERMKSELPKVFHQAAGESLLAHVMGQVRKSGVREILVVRGPDWPANCSLLSNVKSVLQKDRLGTGHAVMQTAKYFSGAAKEVLVLPGDAPCVCAETLRKLVEFHRAQKAVATILTAELADPFGYGRVIRRGEKVAAIREELDASEEERKICEINSGIYVFDSRTLFQYLSEIGQNAKKKEYYLTDVIERMTAAGGSVVAWKSADSYEALGVNTRMDLAMVNKILIDREMRRHAENGVTILDPDKTVIQSNVRIGRDSVIHPFTWIESGAVIGEKCEIGPFAKIRAGSEIQDEAVVGSFVEVVRSKIGKKTFVKHLSYIGDAELGQQVNVGAGTVTANFDGKKKNKTVVADGVFLGCNTVLISPVKVGKGAKTGAGAVVCAGKDVPAGKTVVGVPAKLMGKTKKHQ